MAQYDLFAMIIFILQVCIALATVQKLKEDKEDKEQNQSNDKRDAQNQNKDQATENKGQNSQQMIGVQSSQQQQYGQQSNKDLNQQTVQLYSNQTISGPTFTNFDTEVNQTHRQRTDSFSIPNQSYNKSRKNSENIPQTPMFQPEKSKKPINLSLGVNNLNSKKPSNYNNNNKNFNQEFSLNSQQQRDPNAQINLDLDEESNDMIDDYSQPPQFKAAMSIKESNKIDTPERKKMLQNQKLLFEDYGNNIPPYNGYNNNNFNNNNYSNNTNQQNNKNFMQSPDSNFFTRQTRQGSIQEDKKIKMNSSKQSKLLKDKEIVSNKNDEVIRENHWIQSGSKPTQKFQEKKQQNLNSLNQSRDTVNPAFDRIEQMSQKTFSRKRTHLIDNFAHASDSDDMDEESTLKNNSINKILEVQKKRKEDRLKQLKQSEIGKKNIQSNSLNFQTQFGGNQNIIASINHREQEKFEIEQEIQANNQNKGSGVLSSNKPASINIQIPEKQQSVQLNNNGENTPLEKKDEGLKMPANTLSNNKGGGLFGNLQKNEENSTKITPPMTFGSSQKVDLAPTPQAVQTQAQLQNDIINKITEQKAVFKNQEAVNSPQNRTQQPSAPSINPQAPPSSFLSRGLPPKQKTESNNGDNESNKTTGLFGNQPSSTNATQSSNSLLIKNETNGSKPSSSLNLANQNGGLFGNNQAVPPQAPQTSTNGGLLNGQRSSSGTGLFGNGVNNDKPSKPEGGLFGNTQKPAEQVGTGLFGNLSKPSEQAPAKQVASSNSVGSGPFNLNDSNSNIDKPQQQPKSEGGLFGNQQKSFDQAPQIVSGGFLSKPGENQVKEAAPTLFGQQSNPQQIPKSEGGLFGNQQNPPAAQGFLSKPNDKTIQQQIPKSEGGLFGNQQNPPAPQGFLSKPSDNLAKESSQSLFGNQANPQTSNQKDNNSAQEKPQQIPKSEGGLFGNQQNPPAAQGFLSKPSDKAIPQQIPKSEGSLFGNQQNPPAPQGFLSKPSDNSAKEAAPSLFGNQANSQQVPKSEGGLFGNQQNPPAPQGFLSKPSDKTNPQQIPKNEGGLFGNQQNPPAPQGFLSKPSDNSAKEAAPSLFGNQTNPPTSGGSLFNQKDNNDNKDKPQQIPKSEGGLFGNQQNPPAPQGFLSKPSDNSAKEAAPSLFGNQANPPTTGGGLFNQKDNNSVKEKPQQIPKSEGSLFANLQKPTEQASTSVQGGQLKPLDDKQGKEAAPSLFGNQANPPISIGGGLFNQKDNNSSQDKPQSLPKSEGGLFGNQQNPIEQNAPAAQGFLSKPSEAKEGQVQSLFGQQANPPSSNSMGGGLFNQKDSNSNKDKPQQQAPVKSQGGLFGNLTNSSQPQVGSFLSKPNEDKVKEGQSIFGQKIMPSASQEGGLFNQADNNAFKDKPQSASSQNGSIGLFGKQNQSLLGGNNNNLFGGSAGTGLFTKPEGASQQ